MRLKIIFVLTIWWSVVFAHAQQSLVEGRVVDSNDNPLYRVNIHVVNTGVKTQTNRNGYFQFYTELEKKELVVSFTSIGYKGVNLNVKLPQNNSIKVILETQAIVMDEVLVSTGYQNIPKERTTGSFSVVDNQLYNNIFSTDVISRLDGLVPGLFFDKRLGSEQRFQIRGVSTLAAPSTGLADPLIILDNFPYEGDINNLNPNDVESITFLKDAAAASIWGAKAGNGVVVITTKKASYDRPFKVALSSNVSFSEKPNLWYLPQMSTSDYIDTEIFLFGKGAYNANLANTTSRPVITPVVELLDQAKKNIITEDEAMRQIDELRHLDIRNDYDRFFYRPSFKQQYALSLSGGNENISYLFSGGWDKNLAELRENKMDRLTLRSINSFKPMKRMEIGVGLTYTFSNSQQNNAGPIKNLGSVAGSRSIYPYAQLADNNGISIALPYNYRTNFVETTGDGKLLDWKYYPLEEIYQKDNTNKTGSLLFNTSINYKVLNWLSADVKYNYQNQLLESRDLQSEELFSTRDMINRFTVIEPDKIIYNLPMGSVFSSSQTTLQSHNVRGQLNVNHQFGNDHQINGLLGGEIRNSMSNTRAGTSYGYDDYLKISSQVDYVKRHPIYASLASDQSIPFRDSYSNNVDRFVSLYVNAAYQYLNRYTVSGSARRDASNLFGVATNNKWKPLWSVGGKWDIGKENFYNVDFIPALSLRATYGYSGNVNNSVPAVVTISYQSSLSPLGREQYALLQNAPNAELRWESVGQFNLASDFELINRRLSGTIEYYIKNSKDLISIMDTDPTIGFSSIRRNSANLRNIGWEIHLNSKNLNGNNSWLTNISFSSNKNKLTKYLYKTNYFDDAVTGSTIPLEPGFPLNSLFSYKWFGLDSDNGDPIGYFEGEKSKDYAKINNPASLNDLQFHGNLLPQYFGSLRNTFGYKDFSLSFTLTGQFGYFFRKSTISYSSLLSTNGIIGHGDYASRWKETGDELRTTVPSSIYPVNSNRDWFYQHSEATVEKGDHVRLQDVYFSYTLKSKKEILKKAKISCYANNLNWIVWQATSSSLDPLYQNRIPSPRNIAISFSTSF